MEQVTTNMKKDYPSLDCPLCGTLRRPVRVNADQSVSYKCEPDHVNHGSTYRWRIAIDGTLID